MTADRERLSDELLASMATDVRDVGAFAHLYSSSELAAAIIELHDLRTAGSAPPPEAGGSIAPDSSPSPPSPWQAIERQKVIEECAIVAEKIAEAWSPKHPTHAIVVAIRALACSSEPISAGSMPNDSPPPLNQNGKGD